LNGKRVFIEAPPNSGSLYFNYKKTFSIVLMALVDAKYKFTAVDIGAYGKSSDGGIFSSLKMVKAFEKNKFNILNGRALPETREILLYVMIGDGGISFKKLYTIPRHTNSQ